MNLNLGLRLGLGFRHRLMSTSRINKFRGMYGYYMYIKPERRIEKINNISHIHNISHTHLVGYLIQNIGKITLDREKKSYKLSFINECDGNDYEYINIDVEPEKFIIIGKFISIQNNLLSIETK